MTDFEIRPMIETERKPIAALLRKAWGGTEMVTRGRLVDVMEYPGFTAWQGDKLIGVATYDVIGNACEILVLTSIVEGIGVGSALINAVKEAATQAGCQRLWLTTTNDNIPAIRFYQKRGFTLAAAHINAVAHARMLKPTIPLMGWDGIPIRDELEFEMEIQG